MLINGPSLFEQKWAGRWAAVLRWLGGDRAPQLTMSAGWLRKHGGHRETTTATRARRWWRKLRKRAAPRQDVARRESIFKEDWL